MKAVILVGGVGSRMRPLTYHTPKPLLSLFNRPILEWILTRLADVGVDEAVLSLGYLPDSFRESYPSNEACGVRLVYACEDEPLDTAGAIGFAARTAGIDETFLVLNGDVLTDLDLAALIDTHRSKGGLATITLSEVEDPSRFGVVEFDETGRATAFVEKPAPGTSSSRWINAGTYVFEPEVLELIEPGRPVSVERETFVTLAERGELFAYCSDSYWLDSGTPEALLAASSDILMGRRQAPGELVEQARVDEGNWVEGAVEMRGEVQTSYISSDVELGDEVVVVGSLLERGVRVGQGASIANSIVMAGAVIGNGARIYNSIVGPRSHIGSDVLLGDLTVVGFDTEIGSGRVHLADKVN